MRAGGGHRPAYMYGPAGVVGQGRGCGHGRLCHGAEGMLVFIYNSIEESHLFGARGIFLAFAIQSY